MSIHNTERYTTKNINRVDDQRVRDSAEQNDESPIPNNWNDIVFENRNKEYGAYFLRKGYSRNIFVSVGITLILTLSVIVYPVVMRWIRSNNPVEQNEIIHSIVTLDQPPPIMPNQPPQPKVQVPPPVKTILKFIPPRVVDKEPEIKDEIPTIEEIKINDTGAETQKGTGEVVFTEPVTEEGGEDPDQIFMVVEQPPEFPGGIAALYAFISKTIRYPASARRLKTEGTVYVSFVVNTHGAVEDVQIMKGVGDGLSEEAARVVGLFPPWKPGKQRGRAVKVRYTLPLQFKI